MSYYPFVQPQSTSFGPLFRLLEDFDTYNRDQPQRQGSLKTFQPKFDVAEHLDRYELHGELPGIDQKDVEIEFTDRQTLTVKGRTERQYTSGTPPGIEAPQTGGAIEGGNSHKATVEDENDQSKSTDVAKKSAGEVGKPAQPQAKYWLSERSVGQFARSFSFPDPIDQDNVKASMKDGILSVLVPKAKKHESRRKITIT